MKKIFLACSLSLGLATAGFASDEPRACGAMVHVTQMDIKNNRITKNEIPVLESFLRLGKMGWFAIEIRHKANSKGQALVVLSWLKDHGYEEVWVKEDSEVPSGIWLYAGPGCGRAGIRALPASAGVQQKQMVQSPSNVVSSVSSGVYRWDEGERLSTVVMRWTGRNVSPVMDATIRRGGQFNVARPEEAVERLSRATGCSIQLSHDPIVVDCSGQHQGAK